MANSGQRTVQTKNVCGPIMCATLSNYCNSQSDLLQVVDVIAFPVFHCPLTTVRYSLPS